MKNSRRSWVAGLAGILMAGAFCNSPSDLSAAATPSRDAAATAVVYNAADPLSHELADFYAEQRGIPAAQVFGITTSIEEEITREEYERSIAGPIRAQFDRLGWWTLQEGANGRTAATRNQIRYLVLMRGVPLKIAPPVPLPLPTPAPGATPHPPRPAPTFPERTEAAVDSELAGLGAGNLPTEAAVPQPYFRSFRPILDVDMPQLMLVARLDAPTGSMVKKMILDAIDAEKNGLWGWVYIDGRSITSEGYIQGDRWLKDAAGEARTKGFPVIEDWRPDVFRANYPMRDAAVYYGWYTDQISGPFLRTDVTFRPGAVAIHIHSFSGTTVRNPLSHWVGPLLLRGAAATIGNVYEPYLDFTPHLDLFNERLMAGFTFGEAAYSSLKAISWMTTVVGDPLYRPFALINDISRDVPDQQTLRPWTAYRKSMLDRRTARQDGTRELLDAGKELKNGMLFEGLAHQYFFEEDPVRALDLLEQARAIYQNPMDRLRTSISQIEYYIAKGRTQDALEMVRRLKTLQPMGPDRQLLDAIELELAPPPPSPAPPIPPVAK